MMEIIREKRPDHEEEGIEIPYDRINPDTLQNMIREFVTREWADLSDSLDDKVGQVLQQLRDKKVKVVFDLRSETGNIVVCR